MIQESAGDIKEQFESLVQGWFYTARKDYNNFIKALLAFDGKEVLIG